MNYSLDNVKKFVEDNRLFIGNWAEEILERASSVAVRGIISSDLTHKIMQNDFLVMEFHRIVFFDVNHTNIIAATMIRNNKEDRKNILPEDMSKALALICQAKVLIEKNRDNRNDTRKYLARACGEALGTLQYAISREALNGEEDQDGEYVFEHLFRAILSFCDYYAVDMTDTLIHSGYLTVGAVDLLAEHGWTEKIKEEYHG